MKNLLHNVMQYFIVLFKDTVCNFFNWVHLKRATVKKQLTIPACICETIIIMIKFEIPACDQFLEVVLAASFLQLKNWLIGQFL